MIRIVFGSLSKFFEKNKNNKLLLSKNYNMNAKKLIIFSFLVSILLNLDSQNLPKYVPKDSLVGWWSFTGNANDSSGNGNHGIPNNGTTLTTDRFGKANAAYYFDGYDDNISISNSFFNNGWKNYTFSAWVNLVTVVSPQSQNDNHVIFNTSPHRGMGLGVNWGNSDKYEISVGSGTPSTTWNVLFLNKSKQSAVASQWKHIVLVKDSVKYSLFIDGKIDTTFIATTAVASYYYKAYFGNIDPSYPYEGLYGKLDDVGIWNRSLKQQEISNLYNDCRLIQTHPVNQTVVVGFNASFSVIVFDTTSVTYQWQENKGSGYQSITNTGQFSGTNSKTLVISNTTLTSNNYQYRCIVSKLTCKDTSLAAKLSVNNINSILSIESERRIEMFPNPFDQKITLSYDNKQECLEVVAFDLLGKIVYHQKLTMNQKEIDLSNLLGGKSYILEITNSIGAKYSYRIFKNN